MINNRSASIYLEHTCTSGQFLPGITAMISTTINILIVKIPWNCCVVTSTTSQQIHIMIC
jgi:hypothetical protein